MSMDEQDLDTPDEIDSEEAMAAEEMQEIRAMLLSQGAEIEERLNATNEETEFEVARGCILFRWMECVWWRGRQPTSS